MPNFNNINQHILTFQYIQSNSSHIYILYIYAHINIIPSDLFKCVKHINNLIWVQVRQYFVQCSLSPCRQFLHLDCDRWTELIRKRAPAEYRVGSGLCGAEAERFRNAEPPRDTEGTDDGGRKWCLQRWKVWIWMALRTSNHWWGLPVPSCCVFLSISVF